VQFTCVTDSISPGDGRYFSININIIFYSLMVWHKACSIAG